MRVEIWADVVCPWCYIGTARFDKALAGFDQRDQVEVVHRSFELDPGRKPAQVEPVQKMLADKFGAQGPAMEQRVASLALAEGLGYRTDRQVGGTLDAHRLVQFAKDHGLQRELLTALYAANFAEAEPIFVADTLVDIAAKAGLDRDEARRVLADPNAYLAAVRADEREAKQLGADAVPFFVIDRRYGVSGAQPVEALGEALRAAWADRRPSDIAGVE
jgi:predicted DsbA family dithiol-disulfide isomerase